LSHYKTSQRPQWESNKHSVFWWSDDSDRDNIVDIEYLDWYKIKMKRTCTIDSSERHYDI